MKICTKCKENKNLGEFHKYKATKDGLQYRCKSCDSQSHAKYRQLNRNKVNAQKKEYREKYKQKIAEYGKEYGKQYREDNKEELASYFKEYQRINKEKIAERKKQYHKDNRDLFNSHNAKRRAQKLNATPPWAELEKIAVLYKKAKWLESLTGLTYHVDHVIPLQGKDVCGLHVWENLQILEKTLNLQKYNKL
jgi:hypothetical protein